MYQKNMKSCFQNFQSTGCCLCGETNNLTGEHKIKRSLLKAELGEDKLYIGQYGSNQNKPKIVQGTRSKDLKFKSRICASCNNDKTQPADLEFHKFNEIASKTLNKGECFDTIFTLPQYSKDTDKYLNICRYFAKLLCCHLSEIDAPCLIKISDFAVGKSNENHIFLKIKEDYSYKKINGNCQGRGYTSHGGLIVNGDKSTELVNEFRSTLTIGQIQYIFYIKLDKVERLEMSKLYPSFSTLCQEKIKEAKEFPMSEQELKSHGFV